MSNKIAGIGPTISDAQIQAGLIRARRERALAMRAAFGALWRALGGAAGSVFSTPTRSAGPLQKA